MKTHRKNSLGTHQSNITQTAWGHITQTSHIKYENTQGKLEEARLWLRLHRTQKVKIHTSNVKTHKHSPGMDTSLKHHTQTQTSHIKHGETQAAQLGNRPWLRQCRTGGAGGQAENWKCWQVAVGGEGGYPPGRTHRPAGSAHNSHRHFHRQ